MAENRTHFNIILKKKHKSVCFLERKGGGAKQTVNYAQELNYVRLYSPEHIACTFNTDEDQLVRQPDRLNLVPAPHCGR